VLPFISVSLFTHWRFATPCFLRPSPLIHALHNIANIYVCMQSNNVSFEICGRFRWRILWMLIKRFQKQEVTDLFHMLYIFQFVAYVWLFGKHFNWSSRSLFLFLVKALLPMSVSLTNVVLSSFRVIKGCWQRFRLLMTPSLQISESRDFHLLNSFHYSASRRSALSKSYPGFSGRLLFRCVRWCVLSAWVIQGEP
jgi:hypothetical protein